MKSLARVTLTGVILTVAANAAELPTSFWPTVQETGSAVEWNTVHSQGTSAADASLHGLFNAENGEPIRVAGGWNDEQLPANPTQTDILSFINRHHDRFGVASRDLEILHSGWVRNIYSFTARQKIDGRPVIGTRVILRVARSGRIAIWGADVQRGDSPSWSAVLDDRAAATSVASMSPELAGTVVQSQEVWVRRDGSLVPAREVGIRTDRRDVKPHALVDAASGEVLGYYNDVLFDDASGVVIGPVRPISQQDPDSLAAFPYEVVRVDQQQDTTDSEGQFVISGLQNGDELMLILSLQGRWAYVMNDDGNDAIFEQMISIPWSDTLLWTTDVGRADEFNAYYHTNFIHDFYKRLDPEFDGLDYSMPVIVGYGTGYDNAFWDGQGLTFGAGGSSLNNLAMFSDVIYHEYTHGVTEHIYAWGSLPYNGQSGAMNEAWSDYFPCSIHNNPHLSPGIRRDGGGYLRNLDNTAHFPEDFVGEVHTDGLIFGGALWDTREAIGNPAFTDSLVHFAKYGLANTFEDYLVEILLTDDDDGDLTNGTPHSAEIYTSFTQHGIGPGNTPKLVVRNLQMTEEQVDGVYMPGETGTIDLSVLYDVDLYPPTAEGTVLTATAGPYIQWQNDTAQLGDILPGHNVNLPEPLVFTVAQDAPALYDWIHFTITANGGDYVTEDSVQIILGSPQILLVDDSSTPGLNAYYRNALQRAGTAAAEWMTMTANVPSDVLDAYPYVIWFTANNQQGISTGEADMLAEYIHLGGNLILGGETAGGIMNVRDNLAQITGIESSFPAEGEYGGMGVDGEPMSEDVFFALGGVHGANNRVTPRYFIPATDAVPLYHYFNSATVAAVYRDDPQGGSSAVFGFNLESLAGVSHTAWPEDVLNPILSHMGFDVSAPEPAREAAAPTRYTLAEPYPNPFNPSTRVAFSLPRTARVTLSVYDILGREVLRAVDGIRPAGRQEVTIDLAGHASGLYLIRLETPQGVKMKKAMLVK